LCLLKSFVEVVALRKQRDDLGVVDGRLCTARREDLFGLLGLAFLTIFGDMTFFLALGGVS
jgi:hypothetical protein